MSSTANFRSRRSAAQLHALAGVEREIRTLDTNNRRKYLRDFSQAFRKYDTLLDSEQIQGVLRSADIVLIGDYHALPAAQRYAASLLEQRALVGDRRIVLGVETIFARDQHVLDEWWRREIDENELRQRIRFDLDWGYDWTPFYELLTTARDHADGVYGLDCMPRGDLRQAPLHDRHAAERIIEMSGRHPDAVIMVLIGESHLAPDHLPRILEQHLPSRTQLTVLQNVDALYWRAAGEKCSDVQAVQVTNKVICVFNSTPLEKYESYRCCLDRWSETQAQTPDLAPAVYNLIDGLARFLNIDRYSPHNGTQPKHLMDHLPEVYCHPSDSALRKRLSVLANAVAVEAIQRSLEERGSIYVSQINTLFIRTFEFPHTAREVARFLHHACQGLPENRRFSAAPDLDFRDRAAALALEIALAEFSARVLCPFGIDGALSPEREAEAGLVMGKSLYGAYMRGSLSKTFLRRLFLARLEEPGRARSTYREVARKVRIPVPSPWA